MGDKAFEGAVWGGEEEGEEKEEEGKEHGRGKEFVQ